MKESIDRAIFGGGVHWRISELHASRKWPVDVIRPGEPITIVGLCSSQSPHGQLIFQQDPQAPFCQSARYIVEGDSPPASPPCANYFGRQYQRLYNFLAKTLIFFDRLRTFLLVMPIILYFANFFFHERPQLFFFFFFFANNECQRKL